VPAIIVVEREEEEEEVEEEEEEDTGGICDGAQGNGSRGRMKGTASRDAAALQKAPSRKRARRRKGEEDEQFKHVRPYSKLQRHNLKRKGKKR
jgi:hypothetical protein